MSEVKRYRKMQAEDIGHWVEKVWGISLDAKSLLLSNAVVVLAADYERLEAQLRQVRDELSEILDWAKREQAPLRQQEINSILRVLAATEPKS